jgi:transposase-like protein
MAQHSLLSATARSLSAAKIMRMSESGVENVFLRLRWPETDGKPVCPDCGSLVCYTCQRSAGQPRWRCKACHQDFSITSGTLFAWHKLPRRTYLLAVAAFCNEVKGKSMLAQGRELDVQYKTAFVLAHKMREAMAASVKSLRIGGQGRTAEIDGAYFGGHIRQENLAAGRIDRRLAENRRLISAATGNARDKPLKPAANKPRHWPDYAQLFCGSGSANSGWFFELGRGCVDRRRSLLCCA